MENVFEYKRLLYAINLIYVPTPATIKLSILLLYRRIFTGKLFTQINYSLGAILIIWCVVMEILGIINCLPINAYWDPSVNGKCLSFRDYSIGYAALNIFTDIAILILPMPMIWRLQLPTFQKVALTCNFLLGSL